MIKEVMCTSVNREIEVIVFSVSATWELVLNKVAVRGRGELHCRILLLGINNLGFANS